MDVAVVEGPRGLLIRCLVPRTRRERTRGLRGRAPLGVGEGMWLERTSSVHTFGMRSTIAVVRLDRAGRVVDTRIVPPRRLIGPSARVTSVLECHVDADVRVGDVVRLAIERSPDRAVGR